MPFSNIHKNQPPLSAKRYILILSFLLLASCKSISFSTKNITFIPDSSLKNQIKLSDSLESEFTLVCTDEDFSTISFSLDDYEKKIAAKHPVSFQISNTPYISENIASPGDTIILAYDNKNKEVFFRRTNSTISNQFFLNRIFDSSWTSHTMPVIDYYRLQELQKTPQVNYDYIIAAQRINIQVDSLMELEFQLLKNLFEAGFMSKEVYHHKELETRYAGFSAKEGIYQTVIKPSVNDSIWKIFCQKLINEQDALVKAGAIRSNTLKTEIENTLRMTLEAFNKELKVNSFQSLVTLHKFIEELFPKNLRTFLLYQSLLEALKKQIYIPRHYISLFKSGCNVKSYKNSISIQYKKTKRLRRQSSKYNSVLTTTGKNTTIDAIINKNKGHLILLDFWATWCIPCRQQLPILKKIETKYANKGFKVISIAFDKDINRWIKTSFVEKLQSNNYILLNSSLSNIVNQFEIKTIPRYILLDRSGNLIHENAPSPGDQKLTELIEKNL